MKTTKVGDKIKITKGWGTAKHYINQIVEIIETNGSNWVMVEANNGNRFGLDSSYNKDMWEHAEKTWDTLEVGDVIVDKDGDERKILGVCGEAVFVSQFGDFDNFHTGIGKKELQKIGYKIKDATEETPEYTMEEACDKMGHKFKIKK